MHMAGKISLLLLVQHAPPPPPYRDSIPGTLVRFETVPVPAGLVTVPTSRGPRTVAVGAFAIGRTEVTWDEYDVWAFRLDLTPQERSSGVDATARPSRPYGAPDRGFGHHGYPALAMTYFAAQAYCAWLSTKTGKRYRLPTDAEWTRAVLLGLGGAPPSLLSVATHSAGTPATRPPRPTPWPPRPPMPSASTTCWAMWPSGSRAWTAGEEASSAAARGSTGRSTWDRTPEPGRRPPGTRPIPSFPRAAGGSRMRHSSASASSANPEPRGATSHESEPQTCERLEPP